MPSSVEEQPDVVPLETRYIDYISGIRFARWVHEQINRTRTHDLGPLVIYNAANQRIGDALWPLISEIAGVRVKQEGEGQLIWTVPSPWHAAVFLRAMQHNLNNYHSRLLFRGQSNSDWPITSSLSRSANPECERKLAGLFGEALHTIWNSDLVLSDEDASASIDLAAEPDMQEAAAQHYGIATDLIDFTSDPDVAVFFACLGSHSKQSRTSSVFFVPIHEALAHGCQIILPPPFADRLYLQRGLFIRSSEPLDRTKLSVGEVRFPTEREFLGGLDPEFQIIRGAQGQVDILPDSTGMLAAASCLRKCLSEYGTPSEARQMAIDKIYESLLGPIAPWELWASYVDAFEESLYSLAIFVENQSEGLGKEVFETIVLQNPKVSCSVVSIYRALATSDLYDENKRDLLNLVSSLITEILNKSQR